MHSPSTMSTGRFPLNKKILLLAKLYKQARKLYFLDTPLAGPYNVIFNILINIGIEWRWIAISEDVCWGKCWDSVRIMTIKLINISATLHWRNCDMWLPGYHMMTVAAVSVSYQHDQFAGSLPHAAAIQQDIPCGIRNCDSYTRKGAS